jgi:hypothetical protein
MPSRLFARKTVQSLLAEAADTEHGLRRALGPRPSARRRRRSEAFSHSTRDFG